MPIADTTVTIASGQSLSTGSVSIAGATGLWMRMPANWGGGDLTFQLATDGVNFFNLFLANGKEYTAKIVPGTVVPFDMSVAKGGGALKIRSGTSVRPVVQGANRDFICSVLT